MIFTLSAYHIVTNVRAIISDDRDQSHDCAATVIAPDPRQPIPFLILLDFLTEYVQTLLHDE